jgi:hypothetical protein
MAERDPYDFSALAPDLDFGDDSMSVLDPHHELALAEELQSGDDFDAEFDAMVSEAEGSWPGPGDDAGYRELQLTLRLLQDGLVDLELEAEEAWLEALLLEEGARQAQVSGEPASAFSFGDLAAPR